MLRVYGKEVLMENEGRKAEDVEEICEEGV